MKHKIKVEVSPGEGAFIERALALPDVRAYTIAVGMLASAPDEVRTQVAAYLSNGRKVAILKTTRKTSMRRAPKLTPAQERKRKKNLRAHFAKLRAEREAKAQPDA